MRHLILNVSILLALGGCGARAHDEEPLADTKAIADQLRANETKWNGLYAAKDAAGLAAIYAPDAALANPGAPLVSGSEAIGKAVTGFVADPLLKVSFASDRIQVAESGDLAYTRGHFTMESTDPGTKKLRKDSGNYLTVWQKQADGSWKAVEDFVTPGAAAAPAGG
ncbi:MAG TPA: SgcJ/EcaC family oxidoreductase [Allosphingosinicella sp.]